MIQMDILLMAFGNTKELCRLGLNKSLLIYLPQPQVLPIPIKTSSVSIHPHICNNRYVTDPSPQFIN